MYDLPTRVTHSQGQLRAIDDGGHCLSPPRAEWRWFLLV